MGIVLYSDAFLRGFLEVFGGINDRFLGGKQLSSETDRISAFTNF